MKARMEQALRRGARLKLGACFLALWIPQLAGADSCTAIQPWISASDALSAAAGKGIRVVSEAQKAEWDTRARSAHDLALAYLEGGGELESTLGPCIEGLADRQNFINAFQSELLDESVARLRAARSPILRDLIRSYDFQLGPRSVALFRLTGHTIQSESPTSEKGGFHRGTRSIFLDVSRIPSTEWLLIFAHELLHSLDPMLSEAVRGYDQPQLLERLGARAQILSDPSGLSREDREALTRWIEAGLGRGLWAEYRAWTLTFAIYDQGLQEKLWPRIEWMERILSSRRKDEALDAFTYRFLDERSEDRESGNFFPSAVPKSLERSPRKSPAGPTSGSRGSRAAGYSGAVVLARSMMTRRAPGSCSLSCRCTFPNRS